ncbi:MAG: DUF86 domain-containing protein [Thermoanaerobaculia bacterium]
MTDPDLIAKKLAAIRDYIGELRLKARPDELETDVRERRFVEHTLQLAIQAALDVASHIVSDERLGEPRTNRQLFALLEGGGWIQSDLSSRLQQMAGFRNILVHGYDVVDLGIVRDILAHRLDDLLELVAAVETRVSRDS